MMPRCVFMNEIKNGVISSLQSLKVGNLPCKGTNQLVYVSQGLTKATESRDCPPLWKDGCLWKDPV